MMEIRQINPRLAVSGQIRPDDIAAVAARGFRAIVCNRPDGEEAGQPRFADVAAAARAAGLEARHIPVSGPVTDTQAAAFGAALSDLPAPVLAYCRSGARSTAIWSAGAQATRDMR